MKKLCRFHQKVFFADDDDFLESIAASSTPTIIVSKNSTLEARNFLEDFVERNTNMSRLRVDPKGQTGELINFEDCLKKSQSWVDWKFSVEIKVSYMLNQVQSETIIADINLLHAFVIKRDINKVKFLLNFAEEEKLNIENLLKSEIKCDIPTSKLR